MRHFLLSIALLSGIAVSGQTNTFPTSGNVGIGTTDPAYKLDVRGVLGINGSSGEHNWIQWWTGNDDNDPAQIWDNDRDMRFGTWDNWAGSGTWSEKMRITSRGNVAIGTDDTQGFKLGVNGRIAATKVKVAYYNNWSDFVFNEDYKLPSLQAVEDHIQTQGHLKDIPSSAEVAENGFFLEEMDAKLLQKIEELTLYTIEQHKELQAQKAINADLEKKLKEQELRLQKIEILLGSEE